MEYFPICFVAVVIAHHGCDFVNYSKPHYLDIILFFKACFLSLLYLPHKRSSLFVHLIKEITTTCCLLLTQDFLRSRKVTSRSEKAHNHEFSKRWCRPVQQTRAERKTRTICTVNPDKLLARCHLKFGKHACFSTKWRTYKNLKKKELKKKTLSFSKLNITGINDLLPGTLKESLPLALDTREKLLLLCLQSSWYP